MRILVACEESQAVTIEFRRLGFEAYSNDIKECSGGYPEWHLQMDCMEAVKLHKWDLIIGHPECTKLAVSGNRWYGKGKEGYNQRLASAKWTEDFWNLCTSVCDHVCFENPVGVLTSLTNMPKPQYIQPYEYGHPESKKTGLFLHNLPRLVPTDIVEPEYIIGKDGKRYSPIHYLTKGSAEKYYGADRSTVRSKTYNGVAKAIAEQWGNYITSK